ncbi:MAG: peptide ABC transporter substrate-binding protein [Alphaproteobacteria bacterium]
MAKVFLGILGICALLLPQQALAEEHRELKIGVSQFPSTLHPFFDEMVAKSLVLGAALRPVTVHDAEWKSVCMLCTELPTYDNGRAKKETHKDGTTGIAATYTLKEGLFWGDGKPVTTKDILFAYEVGKNPKSGVGNGEFFSKDIVSVEASDERSFTIHFLKEKCEFAPINDFYPLPEHLERKIFEKDPETYKARTLYNTASTTPGLFFGPYKIAKVESGALITLEKNPEWKGTNPWFDKVTFRTVENSASLQANLLSGDIDYIAGELGITLDEAISFEKRLNNTHPGRYNTVYKPSLTYEHIDLNLDRKPFDDVRLRQALLYGVNRQALNDQLFGGKQPVADSDINPLDTVFAKDVKKYTYDPAAAEKLLDDAGWEKKEDGFRHNDKGEKLVVRLSTTAGNQSRENIEVAIQSDWRKIGIDTKIDNQPARVLFGDTMRKRKFEGGVMYAWMSAPQNIPKTTLYSSMVPEQANNFAGQNYTGYRNKKMDQIIDDLDIVCAPDKNMALWRDLQVLYAEELPALPLYYRADSFFIPSWLKGVVPTGHLNPSTLWIENWSAAP